MQRRPRDLLVCRYCLRRMENAHELHQHQRIMHSDRRCDICLIDVIAESMEQHFIRVHFVEGVGIRCLICHEARDNFERYLAHIALCAQVSQLFLHQLHISINFIFIKSLSLSLSLFASAPAIAAHREEEMPNPWQTTSNDVNRITPNESITNK